MHAVVLWWWWWWWLAAAAAASAVHVCAPVDRACARSHPRSLVVSVLLFCCFVVLFFLPSLVVTVVPTPDLERARTIADDRGRDLLKLKESATQKEEELSTALKEAVDALHAAQADRAEVEERVLAELADVREKLDGANEQAVSAATEAAATIEALSNDVASLSRGMAKAAAEHKRQLSDARAAASAAKEAATLTAAQLKNQLTVALTDVKAVQEAAAAEKERLETKIAQLQRDGERAAQVTQASEAAYQAEVRGPPFMDLHNAVESLCRLWLWGVWVLFWPACFHSVRCVVAHQLSSPPLFVSFHVVFLLCVCCLFSVVVVLFVFCLGHLASAGVPATRAGGCTLPSK